MDGVLVIDKPKDMTSHDVVDIARKALSTKRIGHTGTLDPNATGVLVLAIGKATKLVKYFTNDSKTYVCKFIIGQAYDSDDITGKLTDELDASHLKPEEIKKELMSFLGKQTQLPPDYSAVKFQGKKLYELARRDIKVTSIEPREVEIIDMNDPEIVYHEKTVEINVTMKVSKGTYIRAIARDLGKQLNNFGCLAELRRTQVNQFSIEDSFTIEQLQKSEVEIKEPFAYLDLPKIYVDKDVKDYIEHGRFLDLELFPEKTDTIIFSKEKEPLAIYYYDEVKNLMRMSVKWC
jgi:tRNA pseudouridine55 synthase